MLGSSVLTGYRIRDRRPTRFAAARRLPLPLALGLLLAAGSGAQTSAQSVGRVLRVSASADLAPVMPALAQNYERKTGVKMIVTSGSSEKQVARIEAGEAVDLFLGADFTFPERLVSKGLTDAKAPVAYAKGSLVLFARKDSPLQPLSLETLQNQQLQTIAIPDQLHTSVGRAAAAAFAKLKVADRLKPKVIDTEDVIKAGELVLSGQAQLAMISLSVAKSQQYQQAGTYTTVPASQYPEMREYAVILRDGNVSAAHQFLDWLLTSDIQSKLTNVGLDAVR